MSRITAIRFIELEIGIGASTNNQILTEAILAQPTGSGEERTPYASDQRNTQLPVLGACSIGDLWILFMTLPTINHRINGLLAQHNQTQQHNQQHSSKNPRRVEQRSLLLTLLRFSRYLRLLRLLRLLCGRWCHRGTVKRPGGSGFLYAHDLSSSHLILQLLLLLLVLSHFLLNRRSSHLFRRRQSGIQKVLVFARRTHKLRAGRHVFTNIHVQTILHRITAFLLFSPRGTFGCGSIGTTYPTSPHSNQTIGRVRLWLCRRGSFKLRITEAVSVNTTAFFACSLF